MNYIYPLIMQGVAKLAKNNPKILGRPWKRRGRRVRRDVAGISIPMGTADVHADDVIYGLFYTLYGYAVSQVYWDPKVDWNDQKQLGRRYRSSSDSPRWFWWIDLRPLKECTKLRHHSQSRLGTGQSVAILNSRSSYRRG